MTQPPPRARMHAPGRQERRLPYHSTAGLPRATRQSRGRGAGTKCSASANTSRAKKPGRPLGLGLLAARGRGEAAVGRRDDAPAPLEQLAQRGLRRELHAALPQRQPHAHLARPRRAAAGAAIEHVGRGGLGTRTLARRRVALRVALRIARSARARRAVERSAKRRGELPPAATAAAATAASAPPPPPPPPPPPSIDRGQLLAAVGRVAP